MIRPLLLCDPGLLVPPADDADTAEHRRFWRQLLAWSADKRVLLGVEGRRALWDRLTAMGWPDYTPPQCPQALARDARRAFNVFLTEIADESSCSPSDIPVLDPKYVLDDELGMAIALDLAEHGNSPLIGTASKFSHWASEAAAIRVTPPPPDMVAMVTMPGEEVEKETDLRVAHEISRRRVTIVGGSSSSHVIAGMCDRFGLNKSQIRWLEAEPNKSPNLDALHGVRTERDVVICITGAIGHAESETVTRRSRRGGIEPILIERRSEIETALCLRFGRYGKG